MMIHNGIRGKCNIITANLDDRQDRSFHILLAVYRAVLVVHWREIFRFNSIGKLPRIRMICAIRIGIVVRHRTFTVIMHNRLRIVGIQNSLNRSTASILHGGRRRFYGIVDAMNRRILISRLGHHRQHNGVGIVPVVTVASAIGIGVFVSHHALTQRITLNAGALRLQHAAALIRNDRQFGCLDTVRTAHGLAAVRSRDGEIRRLNPVRVAIGIVLTVDRVMEHKGSITAAVRQTTGVDSRSNLHRCTAVGDGHRRDSNLCDTVDSRGVILLRSEFIRLQRVNKLPNRVVSSTIRITEAEGHRTRTIDVNHCRTVNKLGRDIIATSICKQRRLRSRGIHRTRSFSSSVRVRFQIRQSHMIGISPMRINLCTVSISISVGDCSLTILDITEDCRVGNWIHGITAPILHRRKLASRQRCRLSLTIHRCICPHRSDREGVRTMDGNILLNRGSLAASIRHRIGSLDQQTAGGGDHLIAVGQFQFI